MFEIVIHKKFAKKLEKMERTQLERIAVLMEVLKGEPIPWKKFDIKKLDTPTKDPLFQSLKKDNVIANGNIGSTLGTH